MLLKEQYQVLAKSLMPYAQKQLGFNKPPVINFLDDQDNSSNPLGKTGFYEPDSKSISVFITGRHPKDILRSIAHELVHYNQDCDGHLSQHLRAGLQDKQYAQNNAKLRSFEEEAYLKGNMIFRDWEDNYKNKVNNSNIRIQNAMEEVKLRKFIRKAVMETLKEEKDKDQDEDGDNDFDDVRIARYIKSGKSKEDALKIVKKKSMAEEESTDMSLDEWKRIELNMLLTEKFIGKRKP